MRLLPLAALLLTSNLVFADPCPEGQLCSSVDMKHAPEGTHKQTLCFDGKCRDAVWVPFKFHDMYVDVNSFRVDEEDVFISFKLCCATSGTIFTVRFDCERELYKTLSIESVEDNKVVGIETPTNKPVKIITTTIHPTLYKYACTIHDLIIHGGE